jgi:hypothetical protein
MYFFPQVSQVISYTPSTWNGVFCFTPQAVTDFLMWFEHFLFRVYGGYFLSYPWHRGCMGERPSWVSASEVSSLFRIPFLAHYSPKRSLDGFSFHSAEKYVPLFLSNGKLFLSLILWERRILVVSTAFIWAGWWWEFAWRYRDWWP